MSGPSSTEIVQAQLVTAALEAERQSVASRKEVSEVPLDLKGHGDCGYRAIIAALLDAHLRGRLTKQQYHAPGLQQVLTLFSRSGANYLPAHFSQLTPSKQLDTIVTACQTYGAIPVVTEAAHALRTVAAQVAKTDRRFDGFRVTDLRTLPTRDRDLTQADNKHTDIDGEHIAAAAVVVEMPITVVAHGAGLAKPETYAPPRKPVTGPGLTIQLEGVHYKARVASSTDAILHNRAPVTKTAVVTKPMPVATKAGVVTPAAISATATATKPQAATPVTTPAVSSATAPTPSVTMIPTVGATTAADARLYLHSGAVVAEAAKRTLKVEQTYRDQRATLEQLLALLLSEKINAFLQQYRHDDYLCGNSGRETPIHRAAVLAWKDSDAARDVWEMLKENDTTRELADALKSELPDHLVTAMDATAARHSCSR